MLLVLLRIDLYTVRYFLVGEASDHLAGLSVPKFDVSVVSSREESVAGVVEADIAHGLSMAKVSTDTAAVLVYFPYLKVKCLAIHM